MGGDDQVPVIALGEALRLALAAVVHPQVAGQVRPVAGPVARHPGDADPAAAGARNAIGGSWSGSPTIRKPVGSAS
jgi:hypothetical protein